MHVAVIMAGGGGTRLWPASRRARPKQLLALGGGGETLLAATARRLAPVAPAARTLVITSAALAADVRAALPGVPADNVIGEPAGRNTAAALGLAAVVAEARDPDAVLACLPADQHVADEARFAATVARATELAAAEDAIVTIGLAPTRPETGFGYLELGAPHGASGARVVQRFVEKPDLATAKRYVASGQYLWNGGMFFLRAQRLRREIRAHLPALADGLDTLAAALARGQAAFTAALTEVYPRLPSISIDHGVMEKTSGLLTFPGDFGWNDVGAWAALADVVPADDHGNHVLGQARSVTHDARGNVIYADQDTLVALVGVRDLVVVRAGDALLVLPRDRAQDVKAITSALAAGGRAEDL